MESLNLGWTKEQMNKACITSPIAHHYAFLTYFHHVISDHGIGGRKSFRFY
jgi:hypothetical protein